MTPNDPRTPTLDEIVVAAIELLDGFVVDVDLLRSSPWADPAE